MGLYFITTKKNASGDGPISIINPFFDRTKTIVKFSGVRKLTKNIALQLGVSTNLKNNIKSGRSFSLALWLDL
jgi:hypothetical protein